MAESIKVGIITRAKGPHLEGYLRSLAVVEGIDRAALVDPSGQAFEKAHAILGERLQTFRDDREMLQTFQPKLAVITLEADQAPAPIQLALEWGCHVLAEKPACVDINDFRKLARAADSKHLHLMLALANRAHPHVQTVRKLVATGTLGKLYGTTFYTIADQTRLTRPEFQQSWLASKTRSGGGYLIWLGIHWIDLVQLVSGETIQQVCGFARNVGGQPVDVEDAAVLALQFDRGMVGTMHSGYYLDRGYQNHCVLWGSQGWLRFDLATESLLEWFSTRTDAPRGVQKVTVTRAANPYAPFVQAAVNCARGTEPPIITGAEGLQVLKVIFASYEAARTGNVQKIGS